MRVGIDVIVVAHRLTAKLFGVCEAVLVERIQIQRSLLVRVLAVTQHVRAVPRTGERGWELGLIHFGLAFGNRLFDGRRLRPMLRGPLVDGGVVGGVWANAFPASQRRSSREKPSPFSMREATSA